MNENIKLICQDLPLSQRIWWWQQPRQTLCTKWGEFSLVNFNSKFVGNNFSVFYSDKVNIYDVALSRFDAVVLSN